MRLELRKAVDGTHFVICIVGAMSRQQIVIPLAPKLSSRIQRMLDAEGVGTELLLPPYGETHHA